MGVKDTTQSLAEKTVGNIRQISEGKAPPGHCPYVLGVLTNGTFSREYKMLSDLRSAIVSHNGSVIKVMQEQPEAKELSQIRRIFSEAIEAAKSDIDSVTVATPCLETLGREIADEYGLGFVSRNQAIMEECQKYNLHSVGLLGTDWDMNLNSPLAQLLKQHAIRVISPTDEGVTRLMTHCVYYEVKGGIYYDGKSYGSEEFCLGIIDDMVKKGKVDGVVLCNGELRYLEKGIRQRWSDLKVINAMPLHWQAIRNFVATSQA
jgi:aspartate/glutamate racemase